MASVTLDIAIAHLTSRKRQTLVSLTGVVLGVAFFLAVSALMRGSEKDFIKRLVDNGDRPFGGVQHRNCDRGDLAPGM